MIAQELEVSLHMAFVEARQQRSHQRQGSNGPWHHHIDRASQVVPHQVFVDQARPAKTVQPGQRRYIQQRRGNSNKQQKSGRRPGVFPQDKRRQYHMGQAQERHR